MQELDTTEASDRIRARAYAIWQSERCPEEEIRYPDASPDRDTRDRSMPDASDAELRANAYGQQEEQPKTAPKRRRA